MSTFEIELRACLGEVLGEEPPVPDTEALLFFKQWLAERNLGLVPIADAATFEWPGHWLARGLGRRAARRSRGRGATRRR